MAPVILEVEKHPDILQGIIVSTGQHREMLNQVNRIFDIRPDYDLSIMEQSQTLLRITVKTIQGLEGILLREKPDMLLVQGDTTTAFAAGLCAFYNKIPVGHVEAGLRTGDRTRPYPEEINRRLISVAADQHYAPTKRSKDNLLKEAVPEPSIYLTGNTVIDALLKVSQRDFNLKRHGLNLDYNKKIVLVTTHRRESFGGPMKGICSAVGRLAKKYEKEIQVVLPAHKNPMVRDVVNEMLGNISNVEIIEPLDYEPFVHLMKASYIILTDSGGVQEEAPSLGKPVLVLREKTERPEAIEAGTVKLIGVDEEAIFSEAEKLILDQNEYNKMKRSVNPYGDGKAAIRIIQSILYFFGFTDKKAKEFNSL
ncbi:MAG: UDP-N-Acetylglucosamine 2-epimerase [Candidatus Saganbacteria bacterium]|uniref:UDP-N-acetylglucosamine 2-epimerase (non-hydrolyzing) n=1 Tax=Candidatus Saganbacteria bacterium TaxID=2575572 RepID=A0A833NZ46_UNCSA|nr:MAG: UDP-N-Acetylglucosamine 2-epimerase [Candidatus Saganbacteria bacterium]